MKSRIKYMVFKKNFYNCKVCNKLLFDFRGIRPWKLDNFVKHHMSYFPEIIIYVHGGCHHNIHRSDKYPQLKPKIEDASKFYNTKLEISTRRYI